MALSELRTDAPIQELCDHFGDWFEGGVKNCAGNGARMTKELYPYTSIFSPIRVNRMTIKNRVVMAPMGNLMMCEEYGRPSEKMIRYFVARAKGGVGLITSGLIPISDKIDPTVTEIGGKVMMPRISPARTLMSGWRDLAQQCHGYGSRFFIQLTPGLGRVGPPTCLVQQTKFPVSASFNRNFYIPELPCLRLSDRKLKRIIKNAGQAAADAKACLIDGVYLHGHEGYLLEQMTNRAFNRRKLGKYADWQRFGLDMVKEIRRRVGPNYPIMYRIDLSLALNETYGEAIHGTSMKKFVNGRTVDMTLEYMKNLVAAGVDIFDVDLGCYDNWWLPHPPGSMPPGCFLEVARTVKEFFSANQIRSNAGAEVPVVGVGKLGYPDLAEAALRGRLCDMVMLGRPLLADPEWPNKAYAGQVEDIRPCIGCQEGCLNEFVEGGHPQCAVNPRTAFEHVYPAAPPKAEASKRIAVVGAGPAGVVAAVTAAARGHRVTLIEKSGKIGGRLIPGSVPKIKFDVDNYRLYLERQVKKAEAAHGLTFLTGTEATADWLADQRFDAVVVATGSADVRLDLPGAENANIVQATDLLMHPELAEGARYVAVIGGGVVGCETAFWLRQELHKEVKVLEMTPVIMNHTCTANRGHLIHTLHKNGVELLNCTRVTGFTPDGLLAVRNVSPTVPDPYDTWHPILPENIENPLAPRIKVEEQAISLNADLIVLAAGGRADDALFLEAQRRRVAPLVRQLGDSYQVGRVFEAVRAAYALALAL